jgi:Cu-Zn family superoxide dismutase
MIKKFIYMGVLAAFLMGASPVVMAQVIGEDSNVDMTKPSDDDSPAGSVTSKLPGETVQTLLYRTDGTKVGFAVFRKAPKGVIIGLNLSKIPSGWHGVHIHTNPDCSPKQFEPFDASGGHLGFEGLAHGFMVGAGPQNGDLPNIWIGTNGTGRAEFYTDILDFEDLVRNKGRSILIDAQADDHITPPSGNSGGHLVCGVVRRDVSGKE